MTGVPVIDIRVVAGPWRAQLPDIDDLIMDSAVAAWRAGGGCGDAVEIGVLLTDDAAVRQLNARHRGRNDATNVLSFPVGPASHAPGAALLGDVVLACETIAAEARAQGKPMADHVRHMVVHGVLHLLGHDHADDRTAAAMERIEAEVLAGFGVADPYRPAPENAAEDAG